MKKKSETNQGTALSITYHAKFQGNDKHLYLLLIKTISKKSIRTLCFKTRCNDENPALGFPLNFSTGTGIFSKERQGNGIETTPFPRQDPILSHQFQTLPMSCISVIYIPSFVK